LMTPAGRSERLARERSFERHCWLVAELEVWFHRNGRLRKVFTALRPGKYCFLSHAALRRRLSSPRRQKRLRTSKLSTGGHHVPSGGSFLACLRSERPPARLIRFEALPTCAWARGSSHTAKHQSETDQVRLFSNK